MHICVAGHALSAQTADVYAHLRCGVTRHALSARLLTRHLVYVARRKSLKNKLPQAPHSSTAKDYHIASAQNCRCARCDTLWPHITPT